MGSIVSSGANDFSNKLREEYPGREFVVTYDLDSGSWRFAEQNIENANGIHIYPGDIEMNGYNNELQKVIEFFKPEEDDAKK